MDLDVHLLMQELAAQRPVFHSEADFQHALAWAWQRHAPEHLIRLETRPFVTERFALDLFVRAGKTRIAIELKHLVRALDATVADEHFHLREQGAHDLGRYDVVKDIVRVERVMQAGLADSGFVIVLSNDARYWTPRTSHAIDAAFRLDEGRILSGSLAWAAHAGGTTKGREVALALSGTYAVRWRDYSRVAESPAGQFRYLLLSVASAAAPAAPRQPLASEAGDPRADRSARPATTLSARAAILAAFTALEGRTLAKCSP